MIDAAVLDEAFERAKEKQRHILRNGNLRYWERERKSKEAKKRRTELRAALSACNQVEHPDETERDRLLLQLAHVEGTIAATLQVKRTPANYRDKRPKPEPEYGWVEHYRLYWPSGQPERVIVHRHGNGEVYVQSLREDGTPEAWKRKASPRDVHRKPQHVLLQARERAQANLQEAQRRLERAEAHLTVFYDDMERILSGAGDEE